MEYKLCNNIFALVTINSKYTYIKIKTVTTTNSNIKTKSVKIMPTKKI